MLSTKHLRLLSRYLPSQQSNLNNVIVCRLLSDGQSDDLPRQLTKKDLRRAVDDAASFDERTGVDQVIFLDRFLQGIFFI